MICTDHEDCRANPKLAAACLAALRAALPVGKRVRFSVRPGIGSLYPVVGTGVVVGHQYWPDYLIVRRDDGSQIELRSRVWRFEPIEGEGDAP